MASATETIVKSIEGVDKRLSVVEGFMKALEKPASQQGLSPEAFLAACTNKGTLPLMIGGDGSMTPVPVDRRAKGIGWGPMLKSMATLCDSRMAAADRDRAAKYLFDAKEKGGLGVTRIEKAALAEGSGITGGYVVPPEFVSNLMQLAIEDSIVESRASKMPMTSLTLTVPSLDVTTVQGAGNTPFLGGVKATWAAEAATRTESEPTFRQTELKAHELSFYAVASNTLLADNAVALDSLLSQLFSAAIAWYTDYAYFQGDGVGKPLGLLNCAATIQVTRSVASHFKFADVVGMLARLYMPSWRGGKTCWVMHQSVFPDLAQLNAGEGYTSGTGRPVWLPIDQGVQTLPGQTAGPWSVGSLMGLPTILTEKLPPLGTTGCVGLFDFSKYLLGQRADIVVEVSPHVRFLNNQMVWRIVWRGDGQPWLNNPVTLADGTNTVSPFVTLTQ